MNITNKIPDLSADYADIKEKYYYLKIFYLEAKNQIKELRKEVKYLEELKQADISFSRLKRKYDDLIIEINKEKERNKQLTDYIKNNY